MRKERNLRDMRKRRVGVTARSRLIVGNQATGTPQIATEIAAPLVSRTPRGTVAAATSECGWKRGDTNSGAKDNRQKTDPEIANRGESGIRTIRGGRTRALKRAHEALPHTPPGGTSPPETPGPLSLGLDCTEGRKSVKGSLRRQNRPPLTDFLPSEEKILARRERGPWPVAWSRLPLVGGQSQPNWRTSPRRDSP